MAPSSPDFGSYLPVLAGDERLEDVPAPPGPRVSDEGVQEVELRDDVAHVEQLHAEVERARVAVRVVAEAEAGAAPGTAALHDGRVDLRRELVDELRPVRMGQQLRRALPIDLLREREKAREVDA